MSLLQFEDIENLSELSELSEIIDNNIIGISTLPVGVGSTGNFVNIGTNNQDPFLSFTNYGTGSNHLFKTNLTNILTGNVKKSNAIITTKTNHGLNIGDLIDLAVFPGITTNVVVQYNDESQI